jgi:hypothetical protein
MQNEKTFQQCNKSPEHIKLHLVIIMSMRLDYVSELQQQRDLLFIRQVIYGHR